MYKQLAVFKTECLKNFTDPDDKVLFAKACDRYEASMKKFLPAFTDFMDPQRTEKFLRLFRDKLKADGSVLPFGGYEDAERTMIGFSPEAALTAASFPITALLVRYNERFSKPPAHRDYLGGVLGLGLERTKIGDIRLAEGGALLYAAADVAEYIAANLERVGHVPVAVTQGGELPGLKDAGTELRFTVASLRLDAVISAAFRLSRAKADALIDGEKVFINWAPVLNGAKTLAEGDKVTVRGLGRVKLESVDGKTKKDRWAVSIIRYG